MGKLSLEEGVNMISGELKTIVDKLNENGKMGFLPETTKEKISRFEKEKNVQIPEKYKEWLLFSDGGELFWPAGIQLYGVENKPLINIDNDDRPNEEYIVIGALASGDPILCEKAGEAIGQCIKTCRRSRKSKIDDHR